jgi:Uma2 family endonuclease
MRKRRRFTLEEHHRMGETGLLDEEERVELIEGEIVEMTPIGSLHASVVAHIMNFS